MWVRESNKVLPDKTLSKEAWGPGTLPVLQQPLVGAISPSVRKAAQATALWGSGHGFPSPGITLDCLDGSEQVLGRVECGRAQHTTHVEVNYSWTLILPRKFHSWERCLPRE